MDSDPIAQFELVSAGLVSLVSPSFTLLFFIVLEFSPPFHFNFFLLVLQTIPYHKFQRK